MTLRKNNCVLSEESITELVNEHYNSNHVQIALEEGGPLGSAFKRKQYLTTFWTVWQYWYVPILQILQQVWNKHQTQHAKSFFNRPSHFKIFIDDRYFKENEFFDELKEFEVCNPHDTSKKKHNISAVY